MYSSVYCVLWFVLCDVECIYSSAAVTENEAQKSRRAQYVNGFLTVEWACVTAFNFSKYHLYLFKFILPIAWITCKLTGEKETVENMSVNWFGLPVQL